MGKELRILHLEDNPDDALYIQLALKRSGYDPQVTIASSADEFRHALDFGKLDVILLDHGLPGFSGRNALDIAHTQCPQIPCIFVTGAADEEQVKICLKAGAADFVLKNDASQLAGAIQRARENVRPVDAKARDQHDRSMRRLVAVVQELSLARSLKTVMEIVRHAARELTGADGATFVLRDGDKCHYAEEDAIAPLWKGLKFPMSTCISGWAMLNRQSAVIEDIYADPRIPADAYRPTFVKSLVMVPIRTSAPIGAIGNYWATRHQATAEEVELLEALANTTSVAMENVRVYEELEARVADRTLQLEGANRELEAFSYSVSHDLQAPLRAVSTYSQFLRDEVKPADGTNSAKYLDRITSETRRMGQLIEDLLRLARLNRIEIKREAIDLSGMVRELAQQLRTGEPQRQVEFSIQEGLVASGDKAWLRVVLDNLLSNAWKYTSKRPQAMIEFGLAPQPDGTSAYFIKDNGAGFDMRYASNLFAPFQRMHRQDEFPGTGVGLSTVQRIIQRHGGRIWVNARINIGATFFFTLPAKPLSPATSS